MTEKAQNIKISTRAWDLLRWAKMDLKAKTYSDVVIKLDQSLQSTYQLVQRSLENFKEDRHRMSVKVPEDDGSDNSKTKIISKTIALTPVAHEILYRIKVESSESAYTFSDALEFLIKHNSAVWTKIPSYLKS